jgi:hypothetical protein
MAKIDAPVRAATLKLRWIHVTLWSSATLAMMLTLMWGLTTGARADDVAHFTQVVGQVEVLKSAGGKVIPATVELGAAEKDGVNTKALSRAQLKFLDDTIMSVAPESQITIESYMFDASKGKRNAVSLMTKGLVHVVVTNVSKVKGEDFVIKTPTAIMGIRGTEFFLLQGEGFGDLFVVTGLVSTRSLAGGEVLVGAGQCNRTEKGQASTQPKAFKPSSLIVLKSLATIGLPPSFTKGSDPVALVNKLMSICPTNVVETCGETPAYSAPTISPPTISTGLGGGTQDNGPSGSM